MWIQKEEVRERQQKPKEDLDTKEELERKEKAREKLVTTERLEDKRHPLEMGILPPTLVMLQTIVQVQVEI